MIENGDDCLMQRLPILPASASTDSLCYQWTLAPAADGKQLASAGTATLHLSGDMKEYFLTAFHSRAKNDQYEYLQRAFNGEGVYQTDNVEWIEHAPQASEAVLKALLIGSNNIQRIDNECYIELNPRNELFVLPIDTARRTQDYCLPLRCRVVRQAEMRLPAACTVTYLPPVFHIETPQGTLKCSFRHDRRENKLVFRQVMEIREKRIPLRQISQWNEALRQWREASSEQVVLKIE